MFFDQFIHDSTVICQQISLIQFPKEYVFFLPVMRAIGVHADEINRRIYEHGIDFA
jgi:hypothetical protein